MDEPIRVVEPGIGIERRQPLSINGHNVRQTLGEMGLYSKPDAQRSPLIDEFENTCIRRMGERYGHQGIELIKLAISFGRYLALEDTSVNELAKGMAIHDAGKDFLPDTSVIGIKGQLTEAQRAMVMGHPLLAIELISTVRLPFSEGVLDIVRHHHEKWGGGGYPNNLSGERIPYLARIAAILDVFSALTTDRPYREAFGQQQALDMIRGMIGTNFEPTLAGSFISFMSNLTPGSETR